MLLFDRPRQHDDLACAARRQRKPSLRRAHVGQRPKHRAKPPDLRRATARDAIRRRASLRMRARRACPSARRPATLRPARARARTAPDASRARPPCARHARHDGTRPRRTPSTPATLRPPRAGAVAPRPSQSGAPRACSGRGMRFRPPPSAQGYRRRAPRARPERARRAPPSSGGAASRSPRPTSSWAVLNAGGKGAGSSSASVRSASSRRPIRSRRRTSRYRACAALTPVAVRFERRPRRVERLRRPAQVARDERDLGLGDDAPRAGHGLFRTEGARRTSQERLRSNEIAELRHRDASKRERRRVVAQGDPLQCAERITRRERTRRGGDQRVHRNPVTLVTPTVRCPALNLSHDRHQPTVSSSERLPKGRRTER